MSKGIRDNFVGLVVRIDLTKEIGVVVSNIDNMYQIQLENYLVYNFSRQQFSVIRKKVE